MGLVLDLLGQRLERRFRRQLRLQHVDVLGLGEGAEEEQLVQRVELVDGHELGVQSLSVFAGQAGGGLSEGARAACGAGRQGAYRH